VHLPQFNIAVTCAHQTLSRPQVLHPLQMFHRWLNISFIFPVVTLIVGLDLTYFGIYLTGILHLPFIFIGKNNDSTKCIANSKMGTIFTKLARSYGDLRLHIGCGMEGPLMLSKFSHNM
jgi:hypothetical protein